MNKKGEIALILGCLILGAAIAGLATRAHYKGGINVPNFDKEATIDK